MKLNAAVERAPKRTLALASLARNAAALPFAEIVKNPESYPTLYAHQKSIKVWPIFKKAS